MRRWVQFKLHAPGEPQYIYFGELEDPVWKQIPDSIFYGLGMVLDY